MTLDPPIRTLLAPNPSPLTGAGTNTWLVGATALVVIDPGPDDPAHLAAILDAVGPGQHISHILVTHAHRDHSALSATIAAATGAPVFAFGTATDGRSALMTSLAPTLPPQGEGLDTAFLPDQRLRDGDSLSGPDWSLTALHTPGHLGGHLCLALGEVLFSGDHVMGWSTTIVSPPDGDMGAYMASLHRLAGQGWRRFLPGHGAPIEDPATRIRELIAHRRQREAQILQSLVDGPAGVPALAARIYSDIPRHLLPAAEHNVFSHLIDLASRNLVKADSALHPAAQYALF
jgi:glyoxylase-like metal-dependent hydrolase (beta-lactamase superfamily II)